MDFSSPVTSALINNINGKTPINLGKEVRCYICDIQVSSYVVLKDHIAGRKHKNQFKFISRKKNKIDLNCSCCNYLSKDADDWHEHVTSEAHVERAKAVNPQPFAEIPPPVLAFTVKPVNPQPVPSPATQEFWGIKPLFSKEEETNIRDQLNEKALRQILAKEKKQWKCTNCNIICQSICAWEAHLASKKHRKNKHKFHTYPGISKELVRNKYQKSFIRAAETIGNEFIEDGVIFYCKRCDVRMDSKLQLEIHMTSNMHKLNHPIAPVPVANHAYVEQDISEEYQNPRYNAPIMNFENSSYGYGHRNWNAESFLFNKGYVPPTRLEFDREQEMERQRLLVEDAKHKLLARFPFYAANLMNQQNQFENVPQPVPPPDFTSDSFELNSIPVPPTPIHLRNLDPLDQM